MVVIANALEGNLQAVLGWGLATLWSALYVAEYVLDIGEKTGGDRERVSGKQWIQLLKKKKSEAFEDEAKKSNKGGTE